MLPKKHFDRISTTWGPPDINLFATRFNCQTEKFVSLFPDPSALMNDAFTLEWKQSGLLYAFPPFNQIGGILSKLRLEGSQMILVTPDWQGATWSPDILAMAYSPPLQLGNILLDIDNTERTLKWNLLAWRLSA